MLENLVMLSFWTFIGTQVALICRNAVQKKEPKRNPLLPIVAILASVLIGLVLGRLFTPADGQASFADTGWSVSKTEAIQADSAGTREYLRLGGSSLPEDVAGWLEANGIQGN